MKIYVTITLYIKLLYAKYTLNWTNIKEIKRCSRGSPNPTYLTLKKANLNRNPKLTSCKWSSESMAE